MTAWMNDVTKCIMCGMFDIRERKAKEEGNIWKNRKV